MSRGCGLHLVGQVTLGGVSDDERGFQLAGSIVLNGCEPEFFLRFKNDNTTRSCERCNAYDLESMLDLVKIIL